MKKICRITEKFGHLFVPFMPKYYCEHLNKTHFDDPVANFYKDNVKVDLSFEISMDTEYDEDNFISFDIDKKTAPHCLNKKVSSANVLITPFAVYFESNNENKITEDMISDSINNEQTYLTLKDGSKYYFYRYKGNADLRYSSVPGQPLTYSSLDFPALILDPSEIQTIVINGDTIYNA